MLGKLAAPPPEPQTDGGSGTNPRQPQDHTHCRICGEVVPAFVEEGFNLYCPDHRPGSYSGPYAEPMDAEASKTCKSARVFATASSLNRVRGRHHPGGPIFSPVFTMPPGISPVDLRARLPRRSGIHAEAWPTADLRNETGSPPCTNLGETGDTLGEQPRPSPDQPSLILSPEPMDRGACESEGSQAPPIESYPSCGPRSSYPSRDGEDILRAREEWLLLRHVELHDFLRDLLEMVTGWRIEDG